MWFQEYYDTELFKGTLLDYVEDDPDNISELYDVTEQVLGVAGYQESLGIKGITNYNFREIDEDVFGKAYETYLVEIRKDRGVYYTPKYVTEYIVSETVGTEFEEKADQFREAIKAEKFDEAEEHLEDFVDIHIVDPACGSGSFLIKALREIWDQYQDVIDLLNELQAEHEDWQTLTHDEDELKKQRAIRSSQEVLNYENSRDLISKIILRHIHGVDLDPRALEVAKLNLWLQAIKLARIDFRYDNISSEDKHVLPDLELNLRHGDSLMALPEDDVINALNSSHIEGLDACTELRNEYLDEPTRENPLNEVIRKLSQISDELDKKFLSNIADDDIKTVRKTKPPLHWPLAFWYVYLEADHPGFDVVIGNPPYYSEPRGYKEDFRLYRQSPAIQDYYEDKMDVFCFFVDRAIDTAHPDARIGHIVPNYWNTRSSVTKMNKKLTQESRLARVIDFDEFPVFDDPDIHSTILILRVCESTEDLYDDYSVDTINVEDADLSVSEVIGALYRESIAGVDSSERTVTFREGSSRLSLGEETTEDLIAHIEGQTTVDIDSIPNSQGAVLPQDKLSLDEDEDEDEFPDDIEEGDGIFVLSNEEVRDLGLNAAEQSLIKPFYRPRQVEPFYIDTHENENLIYTKKNLIDYDGRDVFYEARNRIKEEGLDYSELDDETKEEYK